MNISKKVMTAVAALSLSAIMCSAVGCGEDVTPVVTSIPAEKVVACYTFEDLTKNDAGELTVSSTQAYNAAGEAIEGVVANIKSYELSTCGEGKNGQAWDSTVSSLELPALSSITQETGFSMSFWMYTNGTAVSDWNNLWECGEVVFHLGCISFYEMDEGEAFYVDNFFEGTGGTITEGYNWDCIVTPAGADWIYVTVNFQADGGIDYYVNGQLMITKDGTGLSNAGAVSIADVNAAVIANISSETTKFCTGGNGWIDTVVLGTELTADEVVALYTELSTPVEA